MKYVVLPDGSTMPITCPADYIEARMIARDELGNDLDAPREQ